MVNAIVAAVWTLLIILPLEPLAYILPIMAGGGPGTWLVLGYILYLTVGFCGFMGFSILFYTIEVFEEKSVDRRLAYIGFILMYLGVTSATLLLGVAGATGGYASTIQRLPTQAVRTILLPYVSLITSLALIATAGVIINILTVITARARKQV